MSDGHFCFVSPIHYSLLLFPIPSAAGPHADRPTITQANKAPLTQLCFVRPEYSTLIFQHFSISPSLAVYKHIVYPFSKQAADIRNIYSCWHYIYKHTNIASKCWMNEYVRQTKVPQCPLSLLASRLSIRYLHSLSGGYLRTVYLHNCANDRKIFHAKIARHGEMIRLRPS